MGHSGRLALALVAAGASMGFFAPPEPEPSPFAGGAVAEPEQAKRPRDSCRRETSLGARSRDLTGFEVHLALFDAGLRNLCVAATEHDGVLSFSVAAREGARLDRGLIAAVVEAQVPGAAVWVSRDRRNWSRAGPR